MKWWSLFEVQIDPDHLFQFDNLFQGLTRTPPNRSPNEPISQFLIQTRPRRCFLCDRARGEQRGRGDWRDIQRREEKRKKEREMASATSTVAAPFWRAAGMTYITYSNICASLVRSCLKEPHKTDALSREKVHFSVSKWADGKPEKPSTISSLSFSLSRDDCCCWSVFRFSRSFQICAICRLEPSLIGPVNYMIYLVVWWKVV